MFVILFLKARKKKRKKKEMARSDGSDKQTNMNTHLPRHGVRYCWLLTIASTKRWEAATPRQP